MFRTFLCGAALLSSLILVGCAGTAPTLAGNTGGDTGGNTAPPPPSPTPTPTPTPTISSVNHVVIFMQENRSFDHYFGGALNAYRAKQGLSQEIDGIPPNVSLKSDDGSPNISPFHMVSMCIEDLSGSWQEAHADIDLENPNNPADPPPMDGFAKMAGGFAAHTGAHDTPGRRAMGFYTDQDLPF